MPLDIDQIQYQACFGVITTPALRLVNIYNQSVSRPLKPCTSVFTTTMGLPCAHKIKERKSLGLGL